MALSLLVFWRMFILMRFYADLIVLFDGNMLGCCLWFEQGTWSFPWWWNCCRCFKVWCLSQSLSPSKRILIFFSKLQLHSHTCYTYSWYLHQCGSIGTGLSGEPWPRSCNHWVLKIQKIYFSSWESFDSLIQMVYSLLNISSFTFLSLCLYY